MNFEDALYLLKSGESIRREAWDENDEIFIPYGRMDTITMTYANGMMHDVWEPTVEDILADDWELCL